MKTACIFFQCQRRGRLSGYHASQRQRGVVLIIALIMLVAMTLAGLALVRSVDTATLISGNLAFRQGATTSGDKAVEAAVDWLLANKTLLGGNSASDGYYATTTKPDDESDLTGNGTSNTSDNFNWDVSAKQLPTVDDAGNTLQYVIHRQCSAATASLDPNICMVAVGASPANSKGVSQAQQKYQGFLSGSSYQGYYRITVRVSGPRHTYSYIQAVIVI